MGGIMRNNMQAMADRDIRLNELSGKSSTLQGTADAFTRQSKALQWEMQWQRIRLWILFGFLIIWAVLFFLFFSKHKLILIGSCVVFFALLIISERILVRRWRSQVDAQHARQWTQMGAAD